MDPDAAEVAREITENARMGEPWVRFHVSQLPEVERVIRESITAALTAARAEGVREERERCARIVREWYETEFCGTRDCDDLLALIRAEGTRDALAEAAPEPEDALDRLRKAHEDAGSPWDGVDVRKALGRPDEPEGGGDA